MKLSGLQRQVLQLYRQCLRQARKKPADVRSNFIHFIQREFRKNSSIDKKDFSAIEFLMRTGSRKLELYASPGITNIH